MFLLLQKGIKRSIENHVNKQKGAEEFVVFAFSDEKDNDFEWIDKNEFRYQGIMYDVFKKEIVGNNIRYLCRADHKEMRLFESLESFIKSISDTQSTNENSSGSPIKDFFKDYQSVNRDYKCYIENSDFIFYSFQSEFLSRNSENISPPPEKG